MAGTNYQPEEFDIKITFVCNTKKRHPDDNHYIVNADVMTNNFRFQTVKLYGNSDLVFKKGDRYHIKAVYKRDEDYQGRISHAFDVIAITASKTRSSVINYLCNANIKGVGRVAAEKIYDALGDDAIDMIRNNPGVLDSIPGLKPEQVDAIKTWFANDDLELQVKALAPEASQRFIKFLSDKYGKGAMAKLRRDPYDLLKYRKGRNGIDFNLIDKIGRKLGADPRSKERVKACMEMVLDKYTKDGVWGDKNLTGGNTTLTGVISGNTTTYYQAYMSECAMKLGLDISEIVGYLNTGEYGVKAVWVDGNCELVSTMNLFYESEAAHVLRKLHESDGLLSDVDMKSIDACISDYNDFIWQEHGTRLDMIQLMAIKNCLINRVSVITGGPGCGKTTTLQGVLWCWFKLFQSNHAKRVVMAAPTGKAVRKMRESTMPVIPDDILSNLDNDANINAISNAWLVDYGTIARYTHKLMAGYDSFGLNNPEKGNAINAYQNGRDTLLIIDESSMMSVKSLGCMMQIFPEAHVIFVGDVDQLPSIDPGDVLHDLISSGIKSCALTINHRSKSCQDIIDNAMKIRVGDMGLKYTPGQFEFDEFQADSDDMAEHIKTEYLNCLTKCNQDYSRVCVVAAYNSKGPCAVDHLNSLIRDVVNPDKSSPANFTPAGMNAIQTDVIGQELDGLEHRDAYTGITRPMRIGDRVVITENYVATVCAVPKNAGSNCNSDDVVVNGDQGVIIKYVIEHDRNNRVCDRTVYIRLDDGREVYVEFGDLSHIKLSYVTTVHKSQGCEYDYVYFIASDYLKSSGSFGSTNLIYTAITRAKRYVKIIGSRAGLEYCAKNRRPWRKGMFGPSLAGANLYFI